MAVWSGFKRSQPESRSAVPSSVLRPGKKSSRCWFRSRLASAPILKTAAALNLFLQSIYFALGEREHEITQLKRPMTLKRTDECADDTSSSYNLAILRILGGLIDLLKLNCQPFGFRGGLGWPTSVVDGEQDGCRYCEVTVYHGNFPHAQLGVVRVN